MNTDPITLEVLRNALQSIAEEMGAVLIRTALSPNIKDRRDCSTAIYTAQGELVAQAEHIPLHLGLMPAVVKKVLGVFPPENLAPGDVILSNDPYVCGSHLPDLCLITPVFLNKELIAIAANLAHHVDVGGAAPGSMSTAATEIFQEGLRIPPVKISRQGQLDRDLLMILTHNVRTPEIFRGDLQAQLAANMVGCHRLLELERKIGLEDLFLYMDELINYTERRLRAAIAQIPPGNYQFTDYLEGDGIDDRPVVIKVNLLVEQDRLTVDFTGTSPQVKGPINATAPVTQACVFFAVKAAVDPDLPASGGIAKVIEIITPQGTLVNPNYPAPVAHANINTAQRITDTVLGALAQAVPHLVTAAGTGSMSNLTIGGLNDAQEYFSYVETYGGGQGGKMGQDGMDGVHVNMTNTMNTPVEVIESSYPLRVTRYALRPDTGGPGQFRGGVGLTRQITLLTDAWVSLSTERTIHQPWGLAGGHPGATANCYLETPTGEVHPLPAKFTGELPPGATITLETAGGGGYGRPELREKRLAEGDVASGLVSSGEVGK